MKIRRANKVRVIEKMKIKASLIITACIFTLMMSGCTTKIDKGTALLEEGKYEEAVKIFEKASEKDSMEKEAYRGLGISYYELGQYKKAASAFQNAIDKGAEKTPELYNLLGISYMKTEEYEKAAECFASGKEMEGAGEELRREMSYNEIFALEKAGSYMQAKEKVDSYLQNWPDDEDVKKEAEFLETQAGNQ